VDAVGEGTLNTRQILSKLRIEPTVRKRDSRGRPVRIRGQAVFHIEAQLKKVKQKGSPFRQWLQTHWGRYEKETEREAVWKST